MANGLLAAQPSWWAALNAPVMESTTVGVTPLTIVGALGVLAAGALLHRVLHARATRYAHDQPGWPPERVRTGLQLLTAGMAIATLLTAARVAGLSLDTLAFVWRLFNAPLVVVAGTDVSVVTTLSVALVVFAGFRLSALAQGGVRQWARHRGDLDEGSVGTVQRLLHYTVVGVALVVALQTIGIRLDAILATGAVFAVGFGLAMQSIVQNFVSGIILLLEQSIRPGDVVEVAGRLVRVEAMAVRSTVVVGLDGDRHIVPNSLLVQSTVRNLTMGDKPVRVHTRVGVAYHVDPDAVVAVLAEAASSLSGRIADKAPAVLFDSFGESALLYDVYVWIEEPWRLPAARAELNHRIWKALAAHQMPIPFPQRTVHVTSEPRPTGQPPSPLVP